MLSAKMSATPLAAASIASRIPMSPGREMSPGSASRTFPGGAWERGGDIVPAQKRRYR
ncbi:MAG: hypothetical protein GDA48_07865 [Hormoscilla sp. GM102CHS1]|nr:hypothetical protein [Hormoscilla sp. GM102CHS1]